MKFQKKLNTYSDKPQSQCQVIWLVNWSPELPKKAKLQDYKTNLCHGFYPCMDNAETHDCWDKIQDNNV